MHMTCLAAKAAHELETRSRLQPLILTSFLAAILWRHGLSSVTRAKELEDEKKD